MHLERGVVVEQGGGAQGSRRDDGDGNLGLLELIEEGPGLLQCGVCKGGFTTGER